MIFFLSNFISIATLLFCDFIFLGKDRHFLSNNLFMLCKFTTDAIQLFFSYFCRKFIRKLDVNLLFWIKRENRYEKIVVSAMQNCRVIR